MMKINVDTGAIQRGAPAIRIQHDDGRVEHARRVVLPAGAEIIQAAKEQGIKGPRVYIETDGPIEAH